MKNNFWFHFCFLFSFLRHLQHIEGPVPADELELQLWPMLQPWQHLIQATSGTYSATCRNARSLTGARPGIKPASSQRQGQVLNLLSHSGNSTGSIFGLEWLRLIFKKTWLLRWDLGVLRTMALGVMELLGDAKQPTGCWLLMKLWISLIAGQLHFERWGVTVCPLRGQIAVTFLRASAWDLLVCCEKNWW